MPGTAKREAAMTLSVCPDHPDSTTIGSCQTCGREVCEVCLEDLDTPEEFECPDCGEYGVALFDDAWAPYESEEEGTYEI
jgi:hypothetical protein